MSTIVTRSGKGSPLTNTEVDSNFTNLNTDKLENITGESIKDLSDVNSSMSPTNGQVLTWDNANTRWSSEDASGGIADIVDDTTPQLGGDLDTNGNDITFDDNDKATFGASDDLQIYHNAGYSYIDASNTPDYLFMTTGQSGFYLMDPSMNILMEQVGSGISLDYSSTQKLVTELTGVSVSGNISVSGTVDGRDVASDGTKIDTAYGWGDHASAGYQDGTYVDGIAYENSATLSRSVGDGQQWVKICDLGTGQPQRIYLKVTHTGDNTNCEFEAEVSIAGYGFAKHIIVKNPQRYNAPRVSFIRVHQASSADVEVWLQVEDLTSANGNLTVRSNKAIPTLTATSTEPTWSTSETVYIDDTALNYDVLPSNGILFQDNVKASFGTSEDLKIYHSGSHSFIEDSGSGDLRLASSKVHFVNSANTESMLTATENGAVSLYYDNAEKLSTSSSGVTVTGGVTTTGAALLSSYRSSWTNAPNHDVLHTGWNSSIDDYIFLKVAGNGSAGHGQLIVADNGVYFGRTNSETGTAVVDSATDPFDNATWGYINSSGLTVNGLLSATTKSFVIDHPTKDGFKLRHGSLEGPENGVYVRGRTRENIIELPDYWKGLVDEESITVNITPVGRDQGIYVESWDNQRIVLAGTAIDCFYTVYGERKDVDPFEVEYEE